MYTHYRRVSNKENQLPKKRVAVGVSTATVKNSNYCGDTGPPEPLGAALSLTQRISSEGVSYFTISNRFIYFLLKYRRAFKYDSIKFSIKYLDASCIRTTNQSLAYICIFDATYMLRLNNSAIEGALK